MKSYNPPIVFMHIAKTAGTSLLMMLREHIPIDATVDLTGIDPKSRAAFATEVGNGRVAGRDINDIRLISGHIPFWVCLSLMCRPITLLRDPAELLASFYYYSKNVLSKSEDNLRLEYVKEALELSLEEFVSMRSRNSICKTFCNSGTENNPYSISIAKRNLNSMIFGISEDFDLSSKLMFYQLGLPATSPYQANVTPSKPEITAKQRSVIEAHSSDDFELYDWAAREFKERYRAFDDVS